MISTIILYKDEEKRLNHCLARLSWCSDVVLIIDSNDDVPIPRFNHPHVTIMKRLLDNDFSDQRNYAMQQAKNDWLLFIDADEELSSELEETLAHFHPDKSYSAYIVPRVDVFWGQKMLCGEPGKYARSGILRLVNRTKGKWFGKVHEEYIPTGPCGKLDNVMYHYPHQTIAEFIRDVNFYSSLRAREIQGRPQWRLYFELLVYPPIKFIYTFFVRLGFIDGAAGFVYSFMMSFHSFLVRAKAITKTY